MGKIKGWYSVKYPGASIRRWTHTTLDGNRSISGPGGYGISRSQIDIIKKNGVYVVEIWVNPDVSSRRPSIKAFLTLKEAKSYALNYMRSYPNG